MLGEVMAAEEQRTAGVATLTSAKAEPSQRSQVSLKASRLGVPKWIGSLVISLPVGDGSVCGDRACETHGSVKTLPDAGRQPSCAG